MKTVGIALWVIGALIFFGFTFLYDTSIEGSSDIYGSTRTINIGLQQVQMLAAMAGLAMFLSGTIIHALGTLLETSPRATSAQQEMVVSIPTEPEAGVSESDMEAELAGLGITKDGDRYRFCRHRYDRIEDAILYARSNQWERS